MIKRIYNRLVALFSKTEEIAVVEKRKRSTKKRATKKKVAKKKTTDKKKSAKKKKKYPTKRPINKKR
tara:strand:+ start:181 stop:381 length:201 start_codon:yes stop_codon:yes gene_type:complete